nr:class C beta-lactamase [Roseateles chitosanitabidus]
MHWLQRLPATLSTLATAAAAALLAACALPSAAQPATATDPAGTARPSDTPGTTEAATLRAVVDAAVRPLIAKHDIPGMAVAVTIDGRAYVYNYGLASRESRQPVGDATLFEVGSVSKTFNATLAAYAVARGKMSLDDHPGRFLPALQGHPVDRATLLQLGTYTAGGLPLQVPVEVEAKGPAGMTRYFQDWKPVAAPGEKRLYSNPSIGLFGHVAAVALQQGYADAMESDLLPKLGLTHTHVRVPASAMGDYASGYRGDKPVRVNPGVLDAEAYGIKTTAADLIRFVQLNIDPSGLDPMVRRAIEGTHVGYYEVGAMTQALGWEQYAYPLALEPLQAGNAIARQLVPVKRLAATPEGTRLFNKTGSTGGFGAYVLYVPARRIGVVMLANRVYPNEDRITAGYEILNRLAQTSK